MPECPQNFISHTIQEGDTLGRLAGIYRTTVRELLDVNPGVNPDRLIPGYMLCIPQSASPGSRPQPEYISKKEAELKNAVRGLWEQHVTWTRLAILAIAAAAPGLKLVSDRLLRNSSDMAAAITPFYGKERADRFGGLIREHLLIASQLVTAAKSGDTAAASRAEKDWYANAVDIAGFLASINPFWSREEWSGMMRRHLDLTKAEAQAILGNDTAKSISLFDAIEQQALEMADVMSGGIVRQSPGNFR
jgi:LysM repeat protein